MNINIKTDKTEMGERMFDLFKLGQSRADISLNLVADLIRRDIMQSDSIDTKNFIIQKGDLHIGWLVKNNKVYRVEGRYRKTWLTKNICQVGIADLIEIKQNNHAYQICLRRIMQELLLNVQRRNI